MMRPQVRILLALLISVLLIVGSAFAQTTPPLIVDASGATAQDETAAEPPENTDSEVMPAEEESGEEQTPSRHAKSDAMPADDEADEGQTPSEEQEPPEPEEPAKPPLSKEMVAFRDQVRRTLAQVFARPLNAQSNLPTEIMAFCKAFGHTAEIASGTRSSQKVNGVGAMCWNYPCGGYKLLRTDGKQVVARVGYGHQERPGQLLAMLAQNRVPSSYEVRIGDHHGTIADLVASEKLACRTGLDQSATLIGLSFYTETGETWENNLGDSWSVERLLQEELDRKADASRADVIHRLMAISFAKKQLEGENLSTEDLFERAVKHIEEFHDYALELQNSDGSWHPGFFAYRGTSKDATATLHSTGTILAWLVYSLPEERLEDQRVVLGLTYLNKQLAYRTSRRSAAPSSAREVVGRMNAAQALSLYDVRYFTPRTPKEPEETGEVSQTKQARSSTGRSAPASTTRRSPSRYSSSQSRSNSQRRSY